MNIDDNAKSEIQSLLTGNEDELIDSFYKDLEFGTGGLRGIMGIGSNRMNKYTIGKATQGLANYLNKTYPSKPLSVAIAHDSRNNSKLFAGIVASVFTANGIKVYFFEDLRPTPELSFAIRHFGCQSGVVLTASHNPKEYNGYKAYWNDGAQVTPPHDENIINEVNSIGISDINFEGDDSLIVEIGKEVDDQYLGEIQKLILRPDVIDRQKDLKIVFSSIHGTGITLVPEILKRYGFTNVNTVEEQDTPDGNFPTVVYPNPEEADAMSLAVKKAKEIDADLVMATDPDSDRVGIAAKNNHGEWQLLNGNQTASLLFYYVLSQWKENNKIDGNQFIVKTIVTTDLLDKIAESYEVECPNTLTGFKYIAMLIRENEGKKKFILGGEESYGYLIGDFVRDKDAIASCAAIAEMTAWARDQNKSIFDLLTEIYLEYGFYKEHLISITRKGAKGAEEIQEMMARFRNDPPTILGGSKVTRVRDYSNATEKDLNNGTVSSIDFPSSNVLQFFTGDGSKISARPSGTEPKIKFYFSVNASLDAAENYDKVANKLDERIQGILKDLQVD